MSEQFVLLAHRLGGGHVQAADYTGAAELGDFLLQQRIDFVGRKVRVLDAAPTGSPWFDGGLAALQHRAGPERRPVPVLKYLRDRGSLGGSSALAIHQASLARRDQLRFGKRRVLGAFPRDCWYPHPVPWNALLDEVRGFARRELPADNRLFLLATLVHATGLHRDLPLTTPERVQLRQISRSTAFGDAVGTVHQRAVGGLHVSGKPSRPGRGVLRAGLSLLDRRPVSLFGSPAWSWCGRNRLSWQRERAVHSRCTARFRCGAGERRPVGCSGRRPRQGLVTAETLPSCRFLMTLSASEYL
ncbi:GPP34 family phosphoprotein [Saccharopolyspora sp. NPDC000359]|uniref:GOLPH3/VPS74 family protein n=1 Tax=Saccharopolyspora sp. NPDC000359 TaxID=3154251 RepID=UPI003328D87F